MKIWGKSTVRGLAATVAAVLTISTLTSAQADNDHVSFNGRTHYTGEFHSHTSLSDGVGTPREAYTHVLNNSDADFFGNTEHDVMYDRRQGDAFITDRSQSVSDEWRYQQKVSDEFNASQDELVTANGIEYTWYDGIGHVNVYNTDWRLTTRPQVKGTVDGFNNNFGAGDMAWDYYAFLDRLSQDPEAVGQFNHPSTTSKGNFFNFNGLTPEADASMQLIEVKNDAQAEQFVMALDKGWHVSPTYNGDEHSATWVTSNEAITGVWAKEHTREGLYEAFHSRTTYSTFDENLVLGVSANGQDMGSMLPADTKEIDWKILVQDPDESDSIAKVELVTNNGKVAHTFENVSGRNLSLKAKLPSSEGEYFFVRVTQADGHKAFSAPVWVGEKTRGANYAPAIKLGNGPENGKFGEQITIPNIDATDDSGKAPKVDVHVYNSTGEVPVENGAFTLSNYSDHLIVVHATDDQGNVAARVKRVQVNQDSIDPKGAFQYFGSVAGVGEKPGSAGVSVSTDLPIEHVYAQVRPVGAQSWNDATVLESTGTDVYEVRTIGRTTNEDWIDNITGQILRSHEFTFDHLDVGTEYEYRFAAANEAPSADSKAWTGVKGTFLAGGSDDASVYVTGDVQSNTGDPKDVKVHNQMVAKLQEKDGDKGETLIQVGDFVDNAGRAELWQELFDHVLNETTLQIATLPGNHETYGDLDYNFVTNSKQAIFQNMFNMPKNGVVGETNYSFDRGQIHFSVLNSNVDLADQIAWLQKDVQNSTKNWNVVVGHFSYFGGKHSSDAGMAGDRALVSSTLQQLGVDLYIGGHDHVYKRSRITDGALGVEGDHGVDYVTMGSTGPKFYDNAEHWWDQKVFDEDIQVGSVLKVTDEGLRMETYALDGREVDSFTVKKPEGYFDLGSRDYVDGELRGFGIRSSEGAPENVTVIAATYDHTGERMIDARYADVELRHRGAEQYVKLDEPLKAKKNEEIKLYVWDSVESAIPLKPTTLAKKALDGEGTAENPYLIHEAADFDEIKQDPEGYFQLANDIDFEGVERDQVGFGYRFTGTLDGAGHSLMNFAADPAKGFGVFATNHGTIKDLHVDGKIETDHDNAALLVDENYGTIERVWASGSVTAHNTAAPIAALHFGTIRDSYATAHVRATNFYAGGVVGIARGGSVTENTYGLGSVKADGRNAGGVVTYGNDGTVVRNSVALNPSVSAPSFAHLIVGRVADRQEATLSENYATDSALVGVGSQKEAASADNWQGGLVPDDEIRTQKFFEGLGWDFEATWAWDEDGRRPVLQTAREDAPAFEDNRQPADHERDADGFTLIRTPDDLALLDEYPRGKFRLASDIDLEGVEMEQIATKIAFTGTLDGNGHVISNYSSTQGGLFSTLSGEVKNLGFVDAKVSKDGKAVGALVDTQFANSVINSVYVTGEVRGVETAGGIVGNQQGAVADSYSSVDVSGEKLLYAGGITGITAVGSVLERSYATGSVISETNRSVGGLSGYAYKGTTIRDSVALNKEVRGTSYAHRVVSRVLKDDVAAATLENNFGVEAMTYAVASLKETGPETLNGETVSTEESMSEAFYRDRLGWDFENVWQWSEEGARPILRQATESNIEGPLFTTEDSNDELRVSEDGYVLVGTAEELASIDRDLAGKYRLDADIDLTDAEFSQLAANGSFTGELDGNGHVISHYSSAGGGLFGAVDGSIHDLGVVEAKVSKEARLTGALADLQGESGVFERVFSTGEVEGTYAVGGLVGQQNGQVRDAYSEATVRGAALRYAGGLTGISGEKSVTDHVYATGTVTSETDRSVGGISGYGYIGTTLSNSIALNPSLSGTRNVQSVISRINKDDPAKAILLNNHSLSSASIQGETETKVGPASLNGERHLPEEVASKEFYEGTLGWDLSSVWEWDSDASRPTLAAFSAQN